MRFPLSLTTSLAGYIVKNKVAGRQRFPLVLMLEPLHKCNLTCTGCGRIREYKGTINARLSVEQCLAAVDDCGAPVVSICGGEPLIYPEIGELAARIIERKKHIYLCTNGMIIEKRLHEFQPSSRFFWNVHLDGMAETHDRCVEREGVFEAAVAGIKAAKAAGFQVCTNTTIYRETDMAEVEALLDYLAPLGVDGFILSPAYEYGVIHGADIFMTRRDIHEKFRDVDRLFRKHNLFNSPIYLDFLQGKHEDMPCTAWGNPTYNPMGWKGPCYLITDGHHATFQELIEQTPWERYGKGKDPRCENCMVHCGYEPSAALGVNASFRDILKQIAAQF